MRQKYNNYSVLFINCARVWPWLPHFVLSRLCLYLLALTVWAGAEDNDFRGWREGDWVKISFDPEVTNEPLVGLSEAGIDIPNALLTVKKTFWCKIHKISTNDLLVTTYYYSVIKLKDLASGSSMEDKPIRNKNIEKHNIEKRAISDVAEWPRGKTPPRPLWPL